MIIKRITIKLFVVAYILFFITSCEVDSSCSAIIIVKDVSGVEINGANVKIWAPTTSLEYPSLSTIDWPNEITNNSGEAYFTFDNEAVLEIEANKDGLYGTGYVVLQSGITVQQEITIN